MPSHSEFGGFGKLESLGKLVSDSPNPNFSKLDELMNKSRKNSGGNTDFNHLNNQSQTPFNTANNYVPNQNNNYVPNSNLSGFQPQNDFDRFPSFNLAEKSKPITN